MSKRLSDYSKLEASPLLVLAAQLGFLVRGFEALERTRGSGSKICALSITKDGRTVTDLYLGARMDGCDVRWTDHGGEKRSDRYTIQLRDDGAIRATPRENAPEVSIPVEPAWQ